MLGVGQSVSNISMNTVACLRSSFPGDIVLADRGFIIAEAIGLRQAEIYLPAFTKGKDQLSALEAKRTCSQLLMLEFT